MPPRTDAAEFLARLGEAPARLDAGFAHLPPSLPTSPPPALGDDAADRLHDDYPYAHPLYAGQMLKPPHPIARAIFDEAARRDLHLALAQLPARFFPAQTWPGTTDRDARVPCPRSAQMKPEHLAWGDEIWRRLDAATAAGLAAQ